VNKLLTSFPVVIVTGAGASKWLGKATTYDIYDAGEFRTWSDASAVGRLRQLRDFLQQQDPKDPVDLEHLLDYVLELLLKFDALWAVPSFRSRLNAAKEERDAYSEAYEQALDFMVDYYGNVDRRAAAALYGPFLDGLRAIPGSSIIPLFTLNYDEAVELAIDELPTYGRLDGFREGHPPVWSRDVFERFDAPAGGRTEVALFKLHGSVSWTRRDGSDRIEKTVSVPRRRPGRTHVVLYPTRLDKAIDQEPFATAYQYFEEALGNARLAVFIGTSFRDAEVRKVIKRASDRPKPFTLMAVGPSVSTRDVASRTVLPRERVRAVTMSFQPGEIPALFTKINAELSSGG
jgi:hypothetical protein